MPIVGADLKGFVTRCSTRRPYPGLEGIAGYNPAAVGGAGVTLALEAPERRDRLETTTVMRKDSAGHRTRYPAVFAGTLAYDNDDRRWQGGPRRDLDRRSQPNVAGELVHRRLDGLHVRADAGLQGPGRIVRARLDQVQRASGRSARPPARSQSARDMTVTAIGSTARGDWRLQDVRRCRGAEVGLFGGSAAARSTP